MDFGLTVGIVGTVITIASFVYAIVIERRSKQIKRLIYDRLPPAPIAGAISKESGYSIKIVYEGPNKSTKTVDSVFVQYLRFINLGQVPIVGQDSARGDPLRLEINGGKVLDIKLVNVARDVCQISLEATSESSGAVVAHIDFDFLDYLDGGLIQIITEGERARASLRGTIIGMPQGIAEGTKRVSSVVFPDLGCVLPIGPYASWKRQGT